MNTEELEIDLPIPIEAQKQTVKSSAAIVGMNRTTFIRNYIQTGKISKRIDENGKDYIDISELIRVFGLEKTLNGLREHNEQAIEPEFEHKATLNTDHEQNNPFLLLRVETASLKAEIQGLKSLLEEKQTRILEKESLIQKQQDNLERMQYLLEDKQAKTKPVSLWERLRTVFQAG